MTTKLRELSNKLPAIRLTWYTDMQRCIEKSNRWVVMGVAVAWYYMFFISLHDACHIIYLTFGNGLTCSLRYFGDNLGLFSADLALFAGKSTRLPAYAVRFHQEWIGCDPVKLATETLTKEVSTRSLCFGGNFVSSAQRLKRQTFN